MGSLCKKNILFCDKGYDFFIKRNDPVASGLCLHTAPEILFFQIDFDIPVGRYAEAAVDHNEYGLNNFIVRVFPEQTQFSIGERDSFLIIIRGVDLYMIGILAVTKIV